MLPKSNIEPASPVIPLINIGAGLDIPTGVFVKGQHGESLLLGGLGPVTGITGKGNTFKSTVMNYMSMSAVDRVICTAETHVEDYDTEMNKAASRIEELAQFFVNLKDKFITESGLWNLTNSTVYYANKWFDKLKDYLKEKFASKEAWTFLPFIGRDKKPLKMLLPTFAIVDSFSRFETDDVVKIQDEVELGDSSGNTIHMRQGLSKMRFLMEAPILSNKMFNYLLMSAHLGKDTSIATGPYAPPPEKKLQHMKQGDKIKGVTDQFFFLTTNFFQTVTSAPFINQGTKGPEYPKDSLDVANDSGEIDLVTVDLKVLRAKFGPSGTVVTLAISQREGVLPSLTEFLICKESERFGIEGSLQNYVLTLYPDAKLSRTAIRRKFDTDEKLRRAMNITSELCQMRQFYRTIKPENLEPKHVLEGITKNGYDWDFILGNTRGWWTVNNDAHPSLYFLSTMDIVLMSLGLYHPYWMEEDKKTIKKEYRKD